MALPSGGKFMLGGGDYELDRHSSVNELDLNDEVRQRLLIQSTIDNSEQPPSSPYSPSSPSKETSFSFFHATFSDSPSLFNPFYNPISGYCPPLNARIVILVLLLIVAVMYLFQGEGAISTNSDHEDSIPLPSHSLNEGTEFLSSAVICSLGFYPFNLLDKQVKYLDWRYRTCQFLNVTMKFDGTTVLYANQKKNYVPILWKFLDYEQQQTLPLVSADECSLNLAVTGEFSTPCSILDSLTVQYHLPNYILLNGSLLSLHPSVANLIVNEPLVNMNAGEPAEESTRELKYVVKANPEAFLRDLQSSDRSIESNIVVYYRPNYPSNMGHYLIDDVFAAFVAVGRMAQDLNSFPSPTPAIQLLRDRSCEDQYPRKWYANKAKQFKSCVQYCKSWTTTLLGNSMKSLTSFINLYKNEEVAEEDDFSNHPNYHQQLTENSNSKTGSRAIEIDRIYLRSLVVGVAFTSVRRFYHAGDFWLQFRQLILSRLNLLDLDRPVNFNDFNQLFRITIFDKKHSVLQADAAVHVRSVCNILQLEETIKSQYNTIDEDKNNVLNDNNNPPQLNEQNRMQIELKFVDPSKLDLRAQIEMLLRTDILITPCGGISLMSGFLRPQSIAMFIDYYDPRLGAIAMEGEMWDNMKHLHVFYYPTQLYELIPAYSPIYQLWRTAVDGKTFTYRHSMNFILNSTHLAILLQTAIDQARQQLLQTNKDNLHQGKDSASSSGEFPLVLTNPASSSFSSSTFRHWSLCNPANGYTVNEGICLPNNDFYDSLRHYWTLVKIALRGTCHLE